MDLNVRAFRVVQEAVNGDTHVPNAKKEASRRGGLKGGPARAKSVDSQRRAEIAKKASRARWSKPA
jgi:hypothetical protein